MNLTSITNWIKSNLVISIIVGLVAIFLFFPKMFKGILGTTRRVRHRRKPIVHRRPIRHRSNVRLAITGSRRRRRPATHRRMKGAKKPWQVKGSRAAKLRMARIRRMR
jgi:hypothetical protein